MEKAAEKFSVSYDAKDEDFTKHQIDAYDLGNAIIGMYDIISAANEKINDGAHVELKVTSPVVDEGSVIIDFLLLGAPETLEMLRLLGFSAVGGAVAGGSLIEVVKALKNRTVKEVVIEGEDENAKIIVDGSVIECNKFVAKLAVDRKVREGLHSVIQAPIQGKDNAEFKVLDEAGAIVEVVKEKAAVNFTPLPKGSMETQEKTREKFTAYFVRVNFDSGKGWRIKRQDDQEHSVTVADAAFLAKVGQNKQAFRKEDLFEFDVQIESTYRETRSTHEYTILQVTRHFVDKRRKLV